MVQRKLTSVVAVSMLLGATVPASSQVAVVDTGAIAAACSISAAECQRAIEAAMQALAAAGLAPAEVNAAIGTIAGTAVSAARSLPASERAALAGTMSRLANASTDQAQRDALVRLAGDLSSGSDLTFFAVAAVEPGGNTLGGGGGGGLPLSGN